jgi:hypothetical protein
MKHWGVERRRVPRARPPANLQYRISLHGAFTVRLLDFSASGVLLAAKTEINEGERAELCAIAKAGPVQIPIEIRHVSSRLLPRVGMRFCAGAAFLDPSPEQRARIAAVLRAEGM